MVSIHKFWFLPFLAGSFFFGSVSVFANYPYPTTVGNSIELIQDDRYWDYPSLSELNSAITAIAKNSPGAVRIYEDSTLRGSSVPMVIVGTERASRIDGKKPAILVVGGHHGNEKISVTATMELLRTLTQLQEQGDPTIRKILANFDIYIKPVLNDHGYAHNDRYCKKVSDLNRDYKSPFKAATHAFQTKETQFIRDLLRQIKPTGALAYHSGSEGILYPWCDQENRAPDLRILKSLADRMASVMGFGNKSVQCFDDYPSVGEFIDYAYAAYGTLALTVEISEVKSPKGRDHDTAVAKTVNGTLNFFQDLYEKMNTNEERYVREWKYRSQFDLDSMLALDHNHQHLGHHH